MRDSIKKPLVVITPTTGSPKLLDAIASVRNQTYPNLCHLVVIDGPDHVARTEELLGKSGVPRNDGALQVSIAPAWTGKGGFNGHRIYAAYPHLVNQEYIAFLDEDNWYEPPHIASLVSALEDHDLDFSFSFRRIFSVEKKFLMEDQCESLGLWPVWPSLARPEQRYLIDTSSYVFRRGFLHRTCYLWHSGGAADRKFLTAVRPRAKFGTTCQHTLCYRLGGNPNSVTREFFEKGNETYLRFYNARLPWVLRGGGEGDRVRVNLA